MGGEGELGVEGLGRVEAGAGAAEEGGEDGVEGAELGGDLGKGLVGDEDGEADGGWWWKTHGVWALGLLIWEVFTAWFPFFSFFFVLFSFPGFTGVRLLCYSLTCPLYLSSSSSVRGSRLPYQKGEYPTAWPILVDELAHVCNLRIPSCHPPPRIF